MCADGSPPDDVWAALDGVTEPVVDYEFAGEAAVVRRVNDAFASTFGLSAVEAPGTSLAEVLTTDGAGPDGYPEFERARYEGEVVRPTTNGDRAFRLSVVPLPGGNRQFATYADRARQREYERKVEALHESTRRLIQQDSKRNVARTAVHAAAEILDLSATSVLFIDREADVLRPVASTDRTHELLGDLPDLPVDDSLAGRVYVTGDPIVYEDPSEYPGVYNPDTPLRSEILLPLGDHGVLISGSTEPSAFTDTDLSLVTILASNTAAALDRIEREEALARRERELARQNERLEAFASMVSHDLRNPLNVAMGRVELAARDADSEHLEAAEDALDRMEALVRDLLELARQGDEIGEVEPVDVGEAARDAWSQVDTAGATLAIREGVGELSADPRRLASCLENLFRNAVEHGGPSVAVRVGPTDDGFYVADDGPGIPPAERDEVFDAGYSDAANGTGMGLAIVQEIAEAHGWTVAVTDSADGGARFEFDVGAATGD